MAGEAVRLIELDPDEIQRRAIAYLIAEDRKDRAEREAAPDYKPPIGDLPARHWYFTGSGWASYDPDIYAEGDK